MDKHEYELKIDEMRVAIMKKNGKEAAGIADEFDWKKERDVSLLTSAADAYELNHEFDKAKELLIMAYERTPGSKKLAYRLTLLSARTKSFDEAMEFYEDFVEMAPRDTSKYILQYRIAKYRGMPVEELIRILEEFVDEDMDERWMFELAKLYDQASYVDKCVDMCDEISLWFSTGEYVRKALDIKRKYKPLTKTQEDNYNKQDEEKIEESKIQETVDEVPVENVLNKTAKVPTAEVDSQVKSQATIPFTTIKMEEIRKSLKEQGIEQETPGMSPFNINQDAIDKKEQSAPEFIADEQSEDEFTGDEQSAPEFTANEQSVPEFTGDEQNTPVVLETQKESADILEDEEPQTDFEQLSLPVENIIVTEPAKEVNNDIIMTTRLPDIDIDKIKIATPDILTPSATEVQAGIAADIRKFMADNPNRKEEPKVVDTAPIRPKPATEESQKPDDWSADEPVIDSKIQVAQPTFAQEIQSEATTQAQAENSQAIEVENGQITAENEKASVQVAPADSQINNADTAVEEELEQKKLTEKEKLAERMSMTLDPLFKYEADGQIGLQIPEPKKPEKEITGQLSIEEVLRNLEERGILKTETVNQAVEALDQADQAAKKASIEVAQAAEEQKQQETEIQNIEITDLMDEKELKEAEANASMTGFEFTDESDNTIQQILDEGSEFEPEKMVEGDVVELERPVTDESGDEMTVLDLSFDAPAKKLHPGIAPQTEPVPPTTANLQELFADLDEATKRELGIEETALTFENEELEQQDTETESQVDGQQSEDKDASYGNEEAHITESDEASYETEEMFNSEEAAQEPKESDILHTTRLGNTAEVADEISAAIEAELNNLQLEDETPQETPNPVETYATQENLTTEEAHATQENPNTEENYVAQDSYASESKPEAEEASAVAETDDREKIMNTSSLDIPQIKVSTNQNLSETRSLKLDNVMVSDEEMVAFNSFKSINGLEQRIKDTVVDLTVKFVPNGNSKSGNVMILGDEKSGKTTLAIELIKLINKKRERSGRRIAKVDSSVLNTRGIRGSMKKLMGSDLIVENAQHLRQTVLDEFVAVGQYYTDDMLIIFEGETSAMKTMRGENIALQNMFDHLLIIKEYDVKEWVNYGKKYAAKQNYMIDEMGILALYKAIDDFYGRHQGIDQSDVEAIVNHAIKKAEKKVTRKLTNLFSGKNDDNGMDILKESDFK